MKKSEKIVITQEENGFIVGIEHRSGLEEYKRFVYNRYQDLIRDLNNFLELAEYEVDEEEEEEHRRAYDDDDDC